MTANESSASLKVDGNRLAPGSPVMAHRRVSSPQPLNTSSKAGKKKGERMHSCINAQSHSHSYMYVHTPR